ncbi:MAG: cobalamin B12-binding domain-containing protein [Beijerinckiaceae bacterium]|nr:cobalamin B12-binding domain-containing protein [Beijerinckiaceae bacterium]
MSRAAQNEAAASDLRDSGATGQNLTRQDITQDDIETFCELLASADFGRAMAFLNAASERGVGYDKLLLELLTGAARRLGVQWECDDRPFSQVTVGMSRLHQALQQLASRAPFQTAQFQTRGRALLAPCPGEQHNFGVMILDSVFHRAGWELRTMPGVTNGQLGRIAGDSRFDVIGLSLSCDEQLPILEKAIATVRRQSRNQNVVILVGGRVFHGDPSLAARIGADAAPQDATAAVAAAELLVTARCSPALTKL